MAILQLGHGERSRRPAAGACRPLALGAAFLALAAAHAERAFSAAPSVRASASAKRSAAPSDVTIRKPSRVAAGDVLVAAIVARASSRAAVAPPSGWSLIRRDSASRSAALTQAVYYRVAGSSEPPSYRWRVSSAWATTGAVVAVRGVDRARPVDAHSGAFTARSRSLRAPSVTTSVREGLVLGFFAKSGTGSTTPPHGMVERYDVRTQKTRDGARASGAAYVHARAGATGDKIATSPSRNGSNIGQLVALRPGSASPSAAAPDGRPASGSILWAGGMEDGLLSDWYYPSREPTGDYGGGEYNSGNGDSFATQERARTGSWSVKQCIDSPGGSSNGTRLFRWRETRNAADPAVFSTWLYIPQRVAVGSYLNVFQFKSRTADDTRNEPFWVVGLQNRADGSLYLDLYDWQNRVGYEQALANVPLGRWFELTALYDQGANGDGRIAVWQDGVLLWDLAGVDTTFPRSYASWSVNAYGAELSPSLYCHYVDDARIRKP